MNSFFQHQSKSQKLLKIEQVSEQEKQKQPTQTSLDLMFGIVIDNIKKSQGSQQIIKQIKILFQIGQNDYLFQCLQEKIALTIFKIYHEQFQKNYHKYLISDRILKLPYESKIFLLNVFRQYDEKLYFNQKIAFIDSKLQCRIKFPWEEGKFLKTVEEIKNYQIKMFHIIQGSFDNIFDRFKIDKKERNSENKKRDFSNQQYSEEYALKSQKNQNFQIFRNLGFKNQRLNHQNELQKRFPHKKVKFDYKFEMNNGKFVKF